ncbi:hypothetical protein ACFXKS_30670 [Streptomyces scopuliridis]|uniref:hypothetical protein n=1 Tax=Streptomyces scopuliridis TaxID=452529 RepID=UPI0036A5ACA7
MIRRIQAQLAAHQRRLANEAIQKLREDAEYLDIGPVPGPVRVALRTYYETRWQTWAVLIPVGLVEASFVARLLHGLLKQYAPARVNEAILHPLNHTSLLSLPPWVQFANDLLFVTLGFLLARRTTVYLATWFGLRSVTFERVQRWADLVQECAERARAPHMSQGQHIVSLRLPVLRVKGARSMRGTVPSFSRRRPELRAHANRVVTALRAAEAEFGTDPKEAAQRLARLALKISDRYAQGRVGALLDHEELVEPARRRESLRLGSVSWIMCGAR